MKSNIVTVAVLGAILAVTQAACADANAGVACRTNAAATGFTNVQYGQSGPQVAARQAIGFVQSVQGRVTATGTVGRVHVLTAGASIFLKDRIVTSVKSKILIRLNDDSVLSQGENADMIMDEYVYDGAKTNDVNCVLKFIQGTFRTITGKIVQLNPERFKVRTRQATVGIRGCDIGFRISADDEEVYVLDLPKGHSIKVERDIDAGKKLDAAAASVAAESLEAGAVMSKVGESHDKGMVTRKKDEGQRAGSRGLVNGAAHGQGLVVFEKGVTLSIGGSSAIRQRTLSEKERKAFIDEATPSDF